MANFYKMSEEAQEQYWEIGAKLIHQLDETDLSTLRTDHLEAAIWHARTTLDNWERQPPECYEENVMWHEMVYALEMFKMEQSQRRLGYAVQSLADLLDKKHSR